MKSILWSIAIVGFLSLTQLASACDPNTGQRCGNQGLKFKKQLENKNQIPKAETACRDGASSNSTKCIPQLKSEALKSPN